MSVVETSIHQRVRAEHSQRNVGRVRENVERHV